MADLKPINTEKDIPEGISNTPIGDLLRYQNLGAAPKKYANAELLIGTCIDNHIDLKLPRNFAFVLRDAGANLKPEDFAAAFVTGYAGVRHLALIGHTHCGMSNLESRRKDVISGLVQSGWDPERAAKHFNESEPKAEIGDPATFILKEAKSFRTQHPGLTVEPLIYDVEDHRLYRISTTA